MLAPIDFDLWLQLIQDAQRIYDLAQVTPISEVPLPGSSATQLKLKREDLQVSGSFKLRGATNKVFSLSPAAAARGVVTSSTGNHGLGVAAAAQHRGITAEVVVCSQVSPKKLERIRAYGALVTFAGETPLEAEIAARQAATQSGRTYISPYNDPEVIAGQGTIAAELLVQAPNPDVVYVAVGGGGLISGIGAYLKRMSSKTEVVACWPRNSRVMYECLQLGKIAEFPEEPTLSESTAGGVESGSITFDLCRQVIDRAVLVSEEEILDSMRWAARALGSNLEGAAGVALAAAFSDAEQIKSKNAVVIACGGNLSENVEKLVRAG